MSKPLDRLTLLETFVRIVERGTISAAAKDLGLSQASASRQLAELEKRLGTELITRTTHNLSLTKSGEMCLKEARLLLADWQGFTEQFAETEGHVQGPLKIVAPVALGQTWALDCALDFLQQFPDVTIEWILEDQPIRFSEVGCDLWIKIGKVNDETLIVRSLRKVDRHLVCTPAFADQRKVSSPEHLSDLPCAALIPFEGGQIDVTNKKGDVYRLNARSIFQTNNIFATHKAVLRGTAYAVLPDWLIVEDVKGGRLIKLLPDWQAAALTINAAYAPSRRQTVRLRLFLEAFEQVLAKL